MDVINDIIQKFHKEQKHDSLISLIREYVENEKKSLLNKEYHKLFSYNGCIVMVNSYDYNVIAYNYRSFPKTRHLKIYNRFQQEVSQNLPRWYMYYTPWIDD